jgi:caffeoyl-CoA O-methyltransferase
MPTSFSRRDADLYIRQQFTQEDAHLQKIRQVTREQGLPGVHITAEEGHMLAFLLRTIGARRVIEIGTLAGYSATWIARSLSAGGRLFTCEFNPEHAALARELFDEAGLSERVTVHEGDAKHTLTALSDEAPFDALFIDADKPNLMFYLRWGVLNLRPGGLILAHNAFMRGRIFDDSPAAPVDAMRAFTEAIAAHPQLEGTIIPIGDGFLVARLTQNDQAGVG